MYFINQQSDPNFACGNIGLYKVEDVIQYQFYIDNMGDLKNCGWTFETKPQNNTNKTIYFAIETVLHTSFAHWIYESAIFLYIFKELKVFHPSLKLLLKSKKDFKILFTNFFGIDKKDILYEIKDFNNIVYFPPAISLHDKKCNNDLFRVVVEKFIKNIDGEIPSNKTTKILYLPRQKKENSPSNDRTILNLEEIWNMVKENGGERYDTDNTKNILDQLSVVKYSKTVILDYGSSMLVNGVFCNNSKIIVLHNYYHHRDFPKLGIVFDIISKNNKVIFIKNICDKDPDKFLQFDVKDIKDHI